MADTVKLELRPVSGTQQSSRRVSRPRRSLPASRRAVTCVAALATTTERMHAVAHSTTESATFPRKSPSRSHTDGDEGAKYRDSAPNRRLPSHGICLFRETLQAHARWSGQRRSRKQIPVYRPILITLPIIIRQIYQGIYRLFQSLLGCDLYLSLLPATTASRWSDHEL